MTKALVPWLGMVVPLSLSYLPIGFNPTLKTPSLPPSTRPFVHSRLNFGVDGHTLSDFRKCIRLAEQIDSLVGYLPPRVHNATRPEVLAYVEYGLKSCVGDEVLRDAEVRSAELVGEELAILDCQKKMRLLKSNSPTTAGRLDPDLSS